LRNNIPVSLKEKYWLVSAEMGYGHQRAIYPLKGLAYGGKVLNCNSMGVSDEEEKTLWKKMKNSYEFVSRQVRIPVVGWLFAGLLDKVLYIPDHYPSKADADPTFQVRYLRSMINKGLCKSISQNIKHPPLPLITSFYAPAIAAEMAGHDHIYCIICDTDLSRAWVPECGPASRIIYFVPGTIAARRLISYGVPEKNILITGFPLPQELLGGRNLDILKKNLISRLHNLDPGHIFSSIYCQAIQEVFSGNRFNGNSNCNNNTHPLTITFVTGGAGAQKEEGRKIAKSLRYQLQKGEVVLNLTAGTRPELRDFFLSVKKETINDSPGISVIYADTFEEYFDRFNLALHKTDILWTKPSELSFYCALGIPVVITEPIGPQEKCNMKWLLATGAGVRQPGRTDPGRWISEMVRSGKLAEAAWNGFSKTRKMGTYNIADFLESGSFISSNDPLRR